MPEQAKQPVLSKPPLTLLATIAFVGPGVVWAAEAIGSGELILSTRLGVAFGLSLLWIPVWAVILKNLGPGYLHGRWALTFGEGAMDGYAKIPPGRLWPIVFGLIHILAGAMSIGGLAASVGVVTYTLLGKPPIDLKVVTASMYIVTLIIAVIGIYSLLEIIFMGMMASMVVVTLAVALNAGVNPADVVAGSFSFTITRPAEWATVRAPGVEPVSPDPVVSILPVLAWAAGGSASHIWYSYWVVGSGIFGMAKYGSWGKPGKIELYREFTEDDWKFMRGWIRTQFVDCLMAAILTIVIIGGFFVAGAGVLASRHLLPGGVRLAEVLGEMYTAILGPRSLFFVLVGCLFILWSTNISQTVGWPIIIMDGIRYIYPRITEKVKPQTLRRIITVLMGLWSLAWALGFATAPVQLISWAAALDGAVLVALQCLFVIVLWIYVAPRLLKAQGVPSEKIRLVKPNPVFIAITAVCFVVFLYFSAWYIASLLGIRW